MANLVVVPGSVKYTKAKPASYIAGEAIERGDLVGFRLQNRQMQVMKAKASPLGSGATALAPHEFGGDAASRLASVLGIAVSKAKAGKKVQVVDWTDEPPVLELGCSLTAHAVYCLSTTAGKICPIADVGSSQYLVVVGYGLPANKMLFTGSAFDQVVIP